MQIKVVHIISNLAIGGTQKKLQALVAGLDPTAFEHRIINLGSPSITSEDLEQSGIHVENLELEPSISMAARAPRLVRAVRRFQPDIIQGWLYPGNVAASVAGMATPGAVTVWHIANMANLMAHEPVHGRVAFYMARFLTWQPKKIVYVGHSAEDEHNRIGFPHGKGLTIRNGFDTDTFRPLKDSDRRQLRCELGIGDNEIAVGMIARFSHVKNHSGFIAAMARLKAAGIPARAVLLGNQTGMENPAIAAAIEEFGNKDQFLFLGERLDISRTVACLDIVVNCSFSEGLPRSIAEAMSCGVPAAVTDVGDLRLLVGDTGIVIAGTTPDAIADGIMRLTKHPSSERAEMGRRARQRVIAEFSATNAINQHENLYRSIIS